MSNLDLDSSKFKNLFLNIPLFIDVRAPVEFTQGHLPGAINLPILNDEERAAVGTTYKNQGQQAAVDLGHQLVSGDVKKSRIEAWVKFIQENPSAIIYCFRGGMRSQITRQWIREQGIERPLIKGGYKAVRQFFLSESDRLSNESKFLLITGPTGVGKTILLNEAAPFSPAIDLEKIAHHRGSAFGAFESAQPSQINFENMLAVNLLRVEGQKKILVEDESRMIGQRTVPETFFNRLRESPVVWIEESLETRVENIFQDYIAVPIAEGRGVAALARYQEAVRAISKKLGGERAREILALIETGSHREWIGKLLVYYYDPLYFASLERRKVSVAFKGSRKSCLEFLRNQ